VGNVTPSPIQNDQALYQVLFGTEVTPGAGATKTGRLYGEFMADSKRAVVRDPQMRRSYDGLVNVRRGPWEHSAKYTEDLTFESWAFLLRYGAVKSPSAVSDGNGVPLYSRSYKPSSLGVDTMSAEHGDDGIPFVTDGVRWDGFTIEHSADEAKGAWKFSADAMVTDNQLKALTDYTTTSAGSTTLINVSGGGWAVNGLVGQYVRMNTGTAGNIDEIRRILSNTATAITLETALPVATASGDTFALSAAYTPSIADRAEEYIANPGTKLYMASAYAGIGAAAEIKDRMIGFSLQQSNRFIPKRFSNNTDGVSAKSGRGFRELILTLRMEFDDWNDRRNFEQSFPNQVALRLEQTAAKVTNSSPATYQNAQINIPAAAIDSHDPNQRRSSNRIAVLQYVCFQDSGFGAEIEYLSKSRLATLP
jgi:hypothetical protein